MGSMTHAFAAAVCLLALSGAAHAQSAPPVPAGEQPVDPYIISNDNAGAAPMEGDAVWRAFGGAEGVSRIVDDFVERTRADPRVGGIFEDTDTIRFRRTLKEQFCYILGGGCDYTGRDMASLHADHGITVAEFNMIVEQLQKAMSKEGVPFAAQNRLLAKLAPMKRDIVVR